MFKYALVAALLVSTALACMGWEDWEPTGQRERLPAAKARAWLWGSSEEDGVLAEPERPDEDYYEDERGDEDAAVAKRDIPIPSLRVGIEPCKARITYDVRKLFVFDPLPPPFKEALKGGPLCCMEMN